jgi:3-hydroxybutyryl-CoA dehydrogenase
MWAWQEIDCGRRRAIEGATAERSRAMIQKVGVIGAGVMGTGVAQSLAQTGHHVILIDNSEEALTGAQAKIQQAIRFRSFFGKERDKPKPNFALGDIVYSTDYHLLSYVDFVIENVTEDWRIKQDVYGKIDGICPGHIIFAANTSAIPITRIASVTKRASRVIGTHFMNPAPTKLHVEVIRGFHTSEETIAETQRLLGQMGKEGILVNDSPGFVSNRVLMLMINEAVFLLQDQVATALDVDRIFKSCFGHKMGPLETADLIGLDTILRSLEVLYDSFRDGKFRPCPLLQKMVDAGLYGFKNGRGFYDYSPTS